MSVAEQVAHIVEMLPDDEQVFALEFVKRLMLAWDPDFTKLTPAEQAALDAAKQGEYVGLDSVNWN